MKFNKYIRYQNLNTDKILLKKTEKLIMIQIFRFNKKPKIIINKEIIIDNIIPIDLFIILRNGRQIPKMLKLSRKPASPPFYLFNSLKNAGSDNIQYPGLPGSPLLSNLL